MAISVQVITSTITEQHRRIKTLMETVVVREGPERQDAFAELCRFLAAHEAAEEECIHIRAKEVLQGDTSVVDQRIEEEDKAGQAIAELERLGPDSPEFADKFEHFRGTVIAHAEAEEHDELPRLSEPFDEAEMVRIQQALSRVPDLASQGAQNGASFKEHLQAARAEFRSGAPTAR